MAIKKSNKQVQFIHAVVATGMSLLFGFVLASLPIDKFVDRDNYLNYLQFGAVQGLLLSSDYESLIARLFNDPLWLAINLLLSLNFDPENALRLLIFSSSYLFLKYTIKQISDEHKYTLLALLIILIVLNPQILKNYIVHLRQGLAIAVFLLMLPANAKQKIDFKYAAIIASLIHTSFLFVFLISMSRSIFEYFRFSLPLRVLGMTLILAIGASSFRLIALLFQARQAEIDLSAFEGSGVGFIFWLFILGLLLSEGFKIIRSDENKWVEYSIYYILLYLIFYFITPLSSRIFESCLPLIMISIIGIRHPSISAVHFFLIIYSLYQWLPLFLGRDVFSLSVN